MPNIRRLSAALLSLSLTTFLLTACAGPLEATVAPATAAPAATVAPTALPTAQPAGPVPLQNALPLAAWDEDGRALSLLPVDPLTGTPLEGAGWTDLGSSYQSAVSPDGHTLALLAFTDDAGINVSAQIHFIDLPGWTMSGATITIHTYPQLMQFSADGRSLLVAISAGRLEYVTRYDVATGIEQARATLHFALRSAALTPSGEQWMVYGASSDEQNNLNPVGQVALLDFATLTTVWTMALPNVRDGQYASAEELETKELWEVGQWYNPAVAWAAGAATLYIVPADSEELVTVDFAAQAMSSAAIAPAQTWLDRLLALTAGVAEAKMLNGTSKQAALSPDGSRLYVLGVTTEYTNQYTETPLGLQVIDTATGALLDTVATEARSLTLSADASGAPVLLLEGWGDRQWSEVRALADPHIVLAEYRGQRLVAGRLPNGQPLLLAVADGPYHTVFHVLDTATWAEVAQWKAAGFAAPILLP